MIKQKLPKGWTHEKILEVIDHYENQTGSEAVTEMEEAFGQGRGYRTMHVPIEVEGQVLRLIANAEKARNAQATMPAARTAERRKPYGKQ